MVDRDAAGVEKTARDVEQLGRRGVAAACDVANPRQINELFARLAGYFEPDQIVSLTAFGGLMIATNVFNNAVRVDLDEYLWTYRKPSPVVNK